MTIDNTKTKIVATGHSNSEMTIAEGNRLLYFIDNIQEAECLGHSNENSLVIIADNQFSNQKVAEIIFSELGL